MVEEQVGRKRFPWWVWLLVILFPIPFSIVHWWLTLIMMAIFVVLVLALNDNYTN
jgi:hypothetical protein